MLQRTAFRSPTGLTVAAALLAALAVSCATTTGRKPAPSDGTDAGIGTTLEIVIDGFAHRSGVVRVALFDSPDGFPGGTDEAFRSAVAPITGDTVTLTMEDVPAGRYAVCVHHDEDGNGRMETDPLGRPSEGFGISNNAGSLFGPPSFAAAAFAVATEPVAIRITLNR